MLANRPRAVVETGPQGGLPGPADGISASQWLGNRRVIALKVKQARSSGGTNSSGCPGKGAKRSSLLTASECSPAPHRAWQEVGEGIPEGTLAVEQGGREGVVAAACAVLDEARRDGLQNGIGQLPPGRVAGLDCPDASGGQLHVSAVTGREAPRKAGNVIPGAP